MQRTLKRESKDLEVVDREAIEKSQHKVSVYRSLL
jgi:hypothetical protein